MTPRAKPYTGETGKIYRLSQAYRQGMAYLVVPFLPVFALIPLVAMLNNLRQTGSVSAATIVLTAVMIGVGVLVWRRSKHQADAMCLVLSSGGIAYYGAGITIRATWDNTKEITGGSAMPCLLLHRPAAIGIGLSATRDPSVDRRIPLYLFEYSKHSELARDLRRFAPHLYES